MKFYKKLMAVLLAFVMIFTSLGVHVVYANDINGNGTTDDNTGNDNSGVGTGNNNAGGNNNDPDPDNPGNNGIDDPNQNDNPKPTVGDLIIRFKSGNKDVSLSKIKGLSMELDDKSISNSLKISDIAVDQHKLTIKVDEDSNYLLGKDKFQAEFTIDKNAWTFKDTDGDGNDDVAEYKLDINLYKVPTVKVFKKFHGNLSRLVKVDGKEIYLTGTEFRKGKKYEITAVLGTGKTLIKDPFIDDSYLVEENGKLVLDLTNTNSDSITMHLAESRNIGKYFELDQAIVGDSYIGLKLTKSAKELGIKDMMGIYKGQRSGSPTYYTGENIAIVSLFDEISKVGDEIIILSEMNDGSFSQFEKVYSDAVKIDLEIDEFKAGVKEISGKTEPGATIEVIRKGYTKPFEGLADSEGNFKMKFPATFKTGEVVVIRASLGSDKKSDRLEIKVEAPEIYNFTERLFGQDRYLTSVEISKALYPQPNEERPETVIITSGLNEADALAAGPLAIELKAPILLVKKDSITAEVQNELNRLLAKNIIIVGGEGSVSDVVEKSLRDNSENLIRLSGDNRYATSIEVAKYLKDKYNYKKAILANGIKTIDALTVSGYAAKKDMAILLTRENKLEDEIKEYIESDDISVVDIVGGSGSVSLNIENELGIKFAERISGSTRFLTALEIAKRSFPDSKQAAIVNGRKSVDALTAAPLAYKNEMPILLVERDEIQKDTFEYIKAKEMIKLTIVGGSGSVSENISDQFIALNPEPKE